jgi:NodT family efflux transporter outer membrane factor (OMF) lipoprotein
VLAGCASRTEPSVAAPTLPEAYKPAAEPLVRSDCAPPACAAPALAWQPTDALAAPPSGAWWAGFGDPLLDALQAELARSNATLEAAQAQYRQALALADAARAGLFPTVGASLSATRSRAASSDDGARASSASTSTRYTASLPLSWELDLWGRVRQQVASGRAQAEASAADLAGVRLSQQALLAQQFISLRIADTRIALLQRLLQDDRQTLALTRKRQAAGVVAASDVDQAQVQLSATEAQLLDAQLQREQLENAIAVLLGRPPAAFSLPARPWTAGAETGAADPPPALQLPALPVGLPSTLLRRRPDIVGAERLVAAARSELGVAQLAWFPSLTLSASVGAQALSWSDLLDAPTRVWSWGPQLAATLFDGGLRSAQREQAQAALDAAAAQYRQTVLTALQEVEDQLATLRLLDESARVQEQAVAAARRSLAAARSRYRAGTASALDLVSAQSSLRSAELDRLTLQGRQLAAAVTLIQALGGGWQAGAP